MVRKPKFTVSKTKKSIKIEGTITSRQLMSNVGSRKGRWY